jgi:hypothetical protein
MGAHSSPEWRETEGPQADDLREKARELAAQVNDWLGRPVSQPSPLDGVPPEVAEWCRAARDVLEVAGRG